MMLAEQARKHRGLHPGTPSARAVSLESDPTSVGPGADGGGSSTDAVAGAVDDAGNDAGAPRCPRKQAPSLHPRSRSPRAPPSPGEPGRGSERPAAIPGAAPKPDGSGRPPRGVPPPGN